jgi:hypothetical protein
VHPVFSISAVISSTLLKIFFRRLRGRNQNLFVAVVSQELDNIPSAQPYILGEAFERLISVSVRVGASFFGSGADLVAAATRRCQLAGSNSCSLMHSAMCGRRSSNLAGAFFGGASCCVFFGAEDMVVMMLSSMDDVVGGREELLLSKKAASLGCPVSESQKD